MASQLYNKGKQKLLNGTIDLDGATIKAMLTTSTYAQNIDTHEFRSSVTNEVTGTGYTAGGVTLANVQVQLDLTLDRAFVTADPITLTNVQLTGVRKVVLYKSNGTAATDDLIGILEFTADQIVSGSNGTITISFPATGIFYI